MAMSNKITYAPGVNQGFQSQVLAELQRFAASTGDLIVTSGLRPGDTKEHGKGLAGDILVPSMNLLDLYLTAERFAWTGIGVYPDWQSNGQPVGGLHLDLRVGVPARWMGLGRGANNLYIALNKENLKKYGVV